MTPDQKKNWAIATLALAAGLSILMLVAVTPSNFGDGVGPLPPEPELAQNVEKAGPKKAVSVAAHQAVEEPAASPTPAADPAPAAQGETGNQPGPGDDLPAIGSFAQGPGTNYSWVAVRKESFVVDAGAQTVFGPIPGASDGKAFSPRFIRWDIKANLPLDAGAVDAIAMSPDERAAARGATSQPFPNFPVKLCFTPKTLESQHTCRLTGETRAGYIVLRDLRGTGQPQQIAELAGALIGAKEPLKRATTQNKVTITFYEWRQQ